MIKPITSDPLRTERSRQLARSVATRVLMGDPSTPAASTIFRRYSQSLQGLQRIAVEELADASLERRRKEAMAELATVPLLISDDLG